MQEKTVGVLTFSTTPEAIRFERSAKELHLPGYLIPIPSQLSAGCGLAWEVDIDQLDFLIEKAHNLKLSFDGSYKINY